MYSLTGSFGVSWDVVGEGHSGQFAIANIPAGALVSGYPARDTKQLMRAVAAMYRLADIAGDLEKLVETKRHGG